MSVTALALTSVLAFVAEANPTWVVVTERGPEIPTAWSTALEAEVNANVKMGQNPDASRGDLMVALGCSTWDDACAATVAETLGADVVLSLEVVRHGAGAWLSYQVTSKGAEQLRSKSRVKLPDRQDAGLKMAKALVHEAITGEPATLLVVETNQMGARVLLDGDAVGTTPYVGVGIRPGTHEVRVEPKEGNPIFRRIEVKEADITSVALVVTVAPAPRDEVPVSTTTPAEGGADGGSNVMTYLGYSLVAAAVGGLLIGALTYGASWGVASTIPGGPGWCQPGSAEGECNLTLTQEEVGQSLWLAPILGTGQTYDDIGEYQERGKFLINGLAAAGAVLAGTGVLLGVGGAGVLGYSYLVE